MNERTVPMPVPRGGTLSADTVEADARTFIGEEHLRRSSDDPAPPTVDERPVRSDPHAEGPVARGAARPLPAPAPPSAQASAHASRPPASTPPARSEPAPSVPAPVVPAPVVPMPAPAPTTSHGAGASTLVAARPPATAGGASEPRSAWVSAAQPSAEDASSFDDEIERHRIAPRPATMVRRSPLSAVKMPEEVAAAARDELSDPSPSSVFAPLSGGAGAVGAAGAGAPVGPGPDAETQAAIPSAPASAASAASDEPLFDAPSEPPTIPLVMSGVLPHADTAAPMTAPETAAATASAAPIASSGDTFNATLERTAATPAADGATTPSPAEDALGRLPDRLDANARERLANEATRVRSSGAPSAPTGRGGRGLKAVLLLVGVGLASAGGWASLRADETPWVPHAHAASADLTAALVPHGEPPPEAPPHATHTASAPSAEATAPTTTPRASEEAATLADARPLAARTQPGGAGDTPSRTPAGFFDLSGAQALGLAQALAAGVRPALARASTPPAVRGEVRRANVLNGEAVVDCHLTLHDARTPRVTLHASARAAQAGQRADRLLRLAAERCGAALEPEIAQALAVLARR